MRPGKKQGREVPVAVSQNSRKQPVSPAALNPQPQQRSHTLRSRVLTPTAPRVLKTENQLAPRPRREEVSGGRRHSGSVGGRGFRRAPECSTELRLSRSFALPLWPTSRAPVHRRLPASPPLLVVDRVVRGAALPDGPRGTEGGFTPHPRPLSPVPGARGGFGVCESH